MQITTTTTIVAVQFINSSINGWYNYTEWTRLPFFIDLGIIIAVSRTVGEGTAEVSKRYWIAQSIQKGVQSIANLKR
jgi:hypothetical protein